MYLVQKYFICTCTCTWDLNIQVNCNPFLKGIYLHVWFHELPTECMANTVENRNKTCFNLIINTVKYKFFFSDNTS